MLVSYSDSLGAILLVYNTFKYVGYKKTYLIVYWEDLNIKITVHRLTKVDDKFTLLAPSFYFSNDTNYMLG